MDDGVPRREVGPRRHRQACLGIRTHGAALRLCHFDRQDSELVVQHHTRLQCIDH